MAITAWLAKLLKQRDLLLGERSDFLAVNDDRPDQLIFLEHRHVRGACAGRTIPATARVAAEVRRTFASIVDVGTALRRG